MIVGVNDVMKKSCPTIRIRAIRSNVCDVCTIYHTQIKGEVTSDKAEEQAIHVADAVAMRQQYQNDTSAASATCTVTTIDFAQNVALPHLADTPSMWYFHSLISVSIFGMYTANTASQQNFVYSERTAGKGSNEVVSMLEQYARGMKINVDNDGQILFLGIRAKQLEEFLP
ncbi:TPA: hypothetical protein N0F65_002505, partial [Lagenidium giganteum]